MPRPKSANTGTGKRGRKTELHWAAITGNDEEICNLLQQRPRPKRRTSSLTGGLAAPDVNAQGELGGSALHWAAARGKVDCVNQLMATTSPALTDQDGRTPLHEAAIRGHKDIIKVLLKNAEICYVRATDDGGRTALHWAAESGHEAVVKLLVATGKADADLKDQWGDMALHRAV